MLLTVLVASALGANPYLDEGSALFERMLYEKAAAKLKRAIEVTASTAAERRKAHDLYARTLVALGQTEEASRTFVALLSVDPQAPLPADASPTIRRLFLAAKEQLYPKGRAQLRQVAAPPPRVTVEVVDPWEVVERVELRQTTAEGELAPVKLKPAALLNMEVEPETTTASVVALSAKNETVAALGPLRFEVVPTAEPVAAEAATAAPGRTRWPVIAAGGAAVALLAIGAALSVAAAAESNTAGQQTFGSDIRRHDDLARDKGIAGAVFLGASGAAAVATAVIYFTW